MPLPTASKLHGSSSVASLPEVHGASGKGGGAGNGLRRATSSVTVAASLSIATPLDSDSICSRNWTSERKRFLHEHRQREWLRGKAKHGYIDFSDAERTELRRYFDALATDDDKIALDRLETMLISLGLASTSSEVQRIVEKIDTDGNGELDFDEYLEIFRNRTNSDIFQVFKAMMEGRLGDPLLNFQNVVSTYRRQRILDATGATGVRAIRTSSDKEPLQRCEQILRNFAKLQRTRFTEAAASSDGGASSGAGSSAGRDPSGELLSWDSSGVVPLGSLGMVWQGVANECKLVSSRPSSADRSKRLGAPKAPQAVIDEVISGRGGDRALAKRSAPRWGHTVVIREPTMESADLHNTAMGMFPM